MKFLEEYATDVVAEFIENLNRKYETRIEFLDDNRESIQNDIEEILSNSKNQAKIFVAEDNGLLKGIFIFDTDIEDNSANVWGPFIFENDMELTLDLWEYALNKLHPDVKKFEFAINYKNIFALDFVKQIKAEFYDDNAVFVHKREDYVYENTYKITEAHPKFYEDVKILHKEIFPNYFLNFESKNDSSEKQKIYIVEDEHSSVYGYVHIIYNPSVNDALINFLAVNQQHRRKGYAKKLIQAALNEFYQHEGISECYLRIDLDNLNTEKLYKSIGFNKTFETKIYKYQIK